VIPKELATPSSYTVLTIDDDKTNRRILASFLLLEGYNVLQAENGTTGLDILATQPVDVVLLDVMMPGIDGIEVCRRIRETPSLAHIPIIIVTALDDSEARVRGKRAGCDDFLLKPVDKTELIVRINNLLTIKLYHEHLKHHNELLDEELKRRNTERYLALERLKNSEEKLRNSRTEIINRLSRAAEFRDDETARHVQRMSHYCHLLADKTGLEKEHCNLLQMASPLHDVGKIGISDTILLKPGRLTNEEFETMKRHAEIGYRILYGSETDLLQMAGEIAWTHHEKYDGSGYPRGLKGEDIPIEGRIAAIADVFDALSTDRVYRPALSLEKTLDIMKEGREKHFDPSLLDLFLSSIDELMKIREVFADG